MFLRKPEINSISPTFNCVNINKQFMKVLKINMRILLKHLVKNFEAMADEIIQATIEDDTKTRKKALMRFFSVDSDINVDSNLPTSTFNFYNKDFILKIAQLVRDYF